MNETPSAADVPRAIRTAIEAVLADTGRPVGPIEPARLLAADIGLDSLDLAQTVVLLERALGVDPFRSAATSAPRPAIRTVADLIAVYSATLTSPS